MAPRATPRRPHRATLLALGLSLLATLGAACTSSAPSCVPECRSGFTCVSGACVSACNPECPAGQTCAFVAGSATCVGDAGMSPDAGTDATTGLDAPATDTPATPDVAIDRPVTEAGELDVPVTDTRPTMDVAADAPPACGRPSLPCCAPFFCEPGAACSGGTCVAYARAADECSRPADCTAAQICTGPQDCTTHACYRCGAPMGAGAFGAACGFATDCATGVCYRNHCATACAIGTTGDADCTAASAGSVCTQMNRTFSTPDGGMGPITVLGVCRRGCARNADCTGTETCLALENVTMDRFDWVCGMSAGTTPAGMPCTSGSQCQSLLCVPNAAGSSFVCSARCTTATDCPAAAPRCASIDVTRPSGGLQPTMVCVQ